MAKLRNTTRGDLTAGGVTFPAGGAAVELPDGFADQIRGDVVFAAWYQDGWLVAEEGETLPEPEPVVDELTADMLDAMDKDALMALMDERDIEYDGRLGETKLRETAKAALFPED